MEEDFKIVLHSVIFEPSKILTHALIIAQEKENVEKMAAIAIMEHLAEIAQVFLHVEWIVVEEDYALNIILVVVILDTMEVFVKGI